MNFVHPVEAVIPGAQGRVLAVLAETSTKLNLRTIARLANVSNAQASRVLPTLVELGLVERRELPPSSHFRLVRTNVGAQAVIELARSRDAVLTRIGREASDLPIAPTSVVVFGSLARGEAHEASDIDVLVVRPDRIAEDDENWSASIEKWRNDIRAIAGNPVEILEVSRSEASARLTSNKQVWRDIRREGVVVHGLTIQRLGESVNA